MTKALNIGCFLAEQAIKDCFAQTEAIKKQEDELMAYCREQYQPMFYQRLAYRLQRRHINHLIVNAVLADLPPIQREVIVRKYKKQEMGIKIAMNLNMSISRMITIDRAVQENVDHMLRDMLTVRDVYSRIKVVNMIHVLDLRLGFLDQHPEITPDVNRDWLVSLHLCRKKYRLLYSAMQEIIQNAETTLHCNIIAARLYDPSLTSKALSAICHVSQNGINRHLRTYEEEMSPYLMA